VRTLRTTRRDKTHALFKADFNLSPNLAKVMLEEMRANVLKAVLRSSESKSW
jgi:hypothetical protein